MGGEVMRRRFLGHRLDQLVSSVPKLINAGPLQTASLWPKQTTDPREGAVPLASHQLGLVPLSGSDFSGSHVTSAKRFGTGGPVNGWVACCDAGHDRGGRYVSEHGSVTRVRHAASGLKQCSPKYPEKLLPDNGS